MFNVVMKFCYIYSYVPSVYPKLLYQQPYTRNIGQLHGALTFLRPVRQPNCTETAIDTILLHNQNFHNLTSYK
jgi:hypothetical protein